MIEMQPHEFDRAAFTFTDLEDMGGVEAAMATFGVNAQLFCIKSSETAGVSDDF